MKYDEKYNEKAKAKPNEVSWEELSSPSAPDISGTRRRSGKEISFTVACHLTFDQHEARWFTSYYSRVIKFFKWG